MWSTALPMPIREQIDARCDEFERAWQSGTSPKMEDYLTGVDNRGRGYLLRDLLVVEMHYRRARGESVSDEALIADHPLLSSDVAQALRRLRNSDQRTAAADMAAGRPLAAAVDAAPTVDPSANARGSRGLHIRCPHCTGPVELLADTPFESITCSTCGGAFDLVDREEGRESRPLKTLGRFELLSRLGMGGFGTVWKARDTELDRAVAIKIPRKGQLDEAETEQFFREARAAAQLRHANIVQVHEVGREGDTIFIVSDLVRGEPLWDWYCNTSPDVRTIAQVTVTIADALHHAHQHGVIHRDIKPSNVLMDDDGATHLMDFGLAKREVGEMTMTFDGQILGTPSYMSPEQARGQGHWTDRRSDIYSLGAVLFHMLTGELPFRGNAQMQIIQRLRDDAPDPRSLNRNIPRDLATICVKCLEREPNRRYSTAQEVSQELGRYLRGEPIHARPISRLQRGLRWAQRNPAMATAAGLIVFLAIAGPLAAIVFEAQKKKLEMRISENQHLISDGREDKSRDTSEINRLRQSLDMWEGRGNPFADGSPSDPTSARRSLLNDLIPVYGAKLARQLDQGRYDGEQLLSGHLALAIIHDELGQAGDAEHHYRAAIEQLELLARDHPHVTRYQRALADCYAQLARLQMDQSRPEAVELLARARSIHQHLASENQDVRSQVDWFNSELRSAAATGFGGVDKNLAQAKEQVANLAQAKQQMERDYSASPTEFYDLACYFSGREAILSNPVAVPNEDRATTDSTD